MSKRIPSLLIEDIVDCANNIIQYTSSQTFDEFMNDQRTVDAVIRNFEVIGEAANRLSDEFKERNEIIDFGRWDGGCLSQQFYTLIKGRPPICFVFVSVLDA